MMSESAVLIAWERQEWRFKEAFCVVAFLAPVLVFASLFPAWKGPHRGLWFSCSSEGYGTCSFTHGHNNPGIYISQGSNAFCLVALVLGSCFETMRLFTTKYPQNPSLSVTPRILILVSGILGVFSFIASSMTSADDNAYSHDVTPGWAAFLSFGCAISLSVLALALLYYSGRQPPPPPPRRLARLTRAARAFRVAVTSCGAGDVACTCCCRGRGESGFVRVNDVGPSSHEQMAGDRMLDPRRLRFMIEKETRRLGEQRRQQEVRGRQAPGTRDVRHESVDVRQQLNGVRHDSHGMSQEPRGWKYGTRHHKHHQKRDGALHTKHRPAHPETLSRSDAETTPGPRVEAQCAAGTTPCGTWPATERGPQHMQHDRPQYRGHRRSDSKAADWDEEAVAACWEGGERVVMVRDRRGRLLTCFTPHTLEGIPGSCSQSTENVQSATTQTAVPVSDDDVFAEAGAMESVSANGELRPLQTPDSLVVPSPPEKQRTRINNAGNVETIINAGPGRQNEPPPLNSHDGCRQASAREHPYENIGRVTDLTPPPSPAAGGPGTRPEPGTRTRRSDDTLSASGSELEGDASPSRRPLLAGGRSSRASSSASSLTSVSGEYSRLTSHSSPSSSADPVNTSTPVKCGSPGGAVEAALPFIDDSFGEAGEAETDAAPKTSARDVDDGWALISQANGSWDGTAAAVGRKLRGFMSAESGRETTLRSKQGSVDGSSCHLNGGGAAGEAEGERGGGGGGGENGGRR